MNDISLKQLEIFVAVVEYGGFTRAAEELFFNQSTVSAHISLLEQALGKELFVRSNRRHVRLTKEGEQVYPIARRILNDCAALRTLFSDADSAPVVALGASTVPGQYLVPGYLAAFLKREPEFRYSLRRGDSEQVHRMLKSGQIAVGFVGAVSAPENLDYFPLYDDRLVIAAPNNEHYRAFRERGVYGRELLLEEPFVSREEGSGTDTSLQNYLRTVGLSHDMLHVVARVDDPEAIKQMVSGGVARRGAGGPKRHAARLRDGQKRAQAHDLSHHAQIAAALPHGAKARRLFEKPAPQEARRSPELSQKKARQKPCLSFCLLLLQKAEQAVLFIRLARHGDEVVAGLGDGLAQLRLVDGLFADDVRFALGVGGRDFLHGERVADGVVDVRFAHAAHHAVDLHFGFVHVKIISFHTAQETRVDKSRVSCAI